MKNDRPRGVTTAEAPITAPALPLWQMVLVLVGMPAVYMANSLLPWSVGLLQQHNHAFFLQFWGSIAVLHWGGAALVVGLLKRAGGRLADIGLNLSTLNAAAMVGIPLAVGLTLTLLREASGSASGPASGPAAVLPATTGERLFWIFISLSAAFCEELIYRGFGIRMLRALNVRTWLAVGFTTLAFVLMHGVRVLRPSPFITVSVGGLIFSALFLWRRSLVPGICLHALVDVANIAANQ